MYVYDWHACMACRRLLNCKDSLVLNACMACDVCKFSMEWKACEDLRIAGAVLRIFMLVMEFLKNCEGLQGSEDCKGGVE